MSDRNKLRIYGVDGKRRSPATLTYRTTISNGLWSGFDVATINISKLSEMTWRISRVSGYRFVTWEDLDNIDTSGITDTLTLYNINACLEWANKSGYTPLPNVTP